MNFDDHGSSQGSHLSFVICHLSFVICHLSFGTCHLELGTWNLELGTWNLEPFVFIGLQLFRDALDDLRADLQRCGGSRAGGIAHVNHPTFTHPEKIIDHGPLGS